MNIIAIPCLQIGGTEQQSITLAKLLYSLGLRVKVVVYFEYDCQIIELFNKMGIVVDCLNLSREMSAKALVSRLISYLKVNRPDIIHVQYISPGAIPIIAAKLAGVPRIFATVHQPWTPSHGLRNKFILRAAARLCDRFTVVSETAERSWFGNSHLIEHETPISEQPRHFTLHNAVDVSRLSDLAIQFKDKPDWPTMGISVHAHLIGAVSRIRHEKGIDLLMEAFASITSTDQKPVYLLLVGDGPDRQCLEQRAQALGISDRVKFTGSADWLTAMRWMAQLDVVVVPSRFEGFGLTAAEAMAMGKPVVVSNAQGLTEIVQDQQNGLVFKVGNVNELAKKINTLISNPEFAQRLGEKAKQTIKEKFDIPLFEKNIETLYGLHKG